MDKKWGAGLPQNLREVYPRDVVLNAFADGTDVVADPESEADPNHSTVPNWPPDLFGINALLLNLSGAQQFLTPGNSPLPDSACQMIISEEERDDLIEAAKGWREQGTFPTFAQSDWDVIMSTKIPLGCGPERSKSLGLQSELGANGLPTWWHSALRLMILADETCSKAAALERNGHKSDDWIALVARLDKEQADAKTQNLKSGHIPVMVTHSTRALMLSQDVACVQPKVWTPEVGCTIRSFSQHLALLPPASSMRANWNLQQGELPPATKPLRCLLVPYPYHIDGNPFEVEPASGRWGWFNCRQKWLENSDGERNDDDLIAFFMRLIERAEEGGQPKINVVLLPETAIDFDLHLNLTEKLRARFPDIEFLITGSTSNCIGKKGNIVLSSHFSRLTDGGDLEIETSSRKKHHRWKIDERQRQQYGFEATENISNSASIWEAITLERREIHINPFREQSILTTLICEDLARSEPAHQLVQATGPNIVFVLLMDGPQVAGRWSSRYAMGLADDPGCAVLTLTCRALVHRSNKNRKEPDSWSVSLFRNPQSGTNMIECPPTQEAVAITFEREPTDNTSIDGRKTDGLCVWKIQEESELKVSLDRNDEEDRRLLKSVVRSYMVEG